MNGIDKIITHIKADADAEGQAITDEALKKCDELRVQYEKAAKDESAKILSKGQQDAEVRIDRLGHAAVLESKKQILTAKQEMVSLAFERAVSMLIELPANDYTALLVRLAVSASRTGSEEVILSVGDRTSIGETVCSKANAALAAAGKTHSLKLSELTGNIRGGLILSSGDIEVNCSVDTLVMRLKNEMSAKVAGTLFD